MDKIHKILGDKTIFEIKDDGSIDKLLEIDDNVADSDMLSYINRGESASNSDEKDDFRVLNEHIEVVMTELDLKREYLRAKLILGRWGSDFVTNNDEIDSSKKVTVSIHYRGGLAAPPSKERENEEVSEREQEELIKRRKELKQRLLRDKYNVLKNDSAAETDNGNYEENNSETRIITIPRGGLMVSNKEVLEREQEELKKRREELKQKLYNLRSK